MRRTSFSLAALAFVAVAPIASAQGNQSAASKFTIGLNTGSTSIDIDGEGAETKAGIGYGLSLGYDVIPALRITAGMDMAKVDFKTEGAGDLGVAQFDLGARYSFLTISPKFQPFVLGSLTSRAIGAEDEEGTEETMSGIGYSLGGGMDYRFSHKVSFTGAIRYTTGELSKYEVDGEEVDGFDGVDMSGMRVQLGLTFRPWAGR